jgi:hypothetical protein
MASVASLTFLVATRGILLHATVILADRLFLCEPNEGGACLHAQRQPAT